MYANNNKAEKIYLVYLKSLIRGIILSVLLLLISAFVFYYTTLDEKYMSSIVWIITVLGICYSSIFGSYRIGSRGLVHGILIGMIYTGILGIIAVLAEKGDINTMSYLIMLTMSVIIGALSGVIGNVLGKNWASY